MSGLINQFDDKQSFDNKMIPTCSYNSINNNYHLNDSNSNGMNFTAS
jgi:hypothetical protein